MTDWREDYDLILEGYDKPLSPLLQLAGKRLLERTDTEVFDVLEDVWKEWRVQEALRLELAMFGTQREYGMGYYV